ncbi:MAG: HAD-IC family P-type ATPase, partial [Exilibacterium sp.]
IEDYHSGVSPAQKLAHIRRRQAQGDIVLMVGDGINDIPVLGGADISVAMGAATDLAQSRADSILLHGDLRVLAQALQFSRCTRRVIRQNISWALLYNGVALPLAAAGWVPPYAAAIGMSLSSLVVVVNALRLGKKAQDPVASKR